MARRHRTEGRTGTGGGIRVMFDFLFWKTVSRCVVIDPAFAMHTTEFRDQVHRLRLDWRRQQRKFPGGWTTCYAKPT
jgi:hypothetical protein